MKTLDKWAEKFGGREKRVRVSISISGILRFLKKRKQKKAETERKEIEKWD